MQPFGWVPTIVSAAVPRVITRLPESMPICGVEPGQDRVVVPERAHVPTNAAAPLAPPASPLDASPSSAPGLAPARAAPGRERQVRASNEPAMALYRSLGFVEEGRKTRRLKLGPDAYLDDVYMALWVGP